MHQRDVSGKAREKKQGKVKCTVLLALLEGCPTQRTTLQFCHESASPYARVSIRYRQVLCALLDCLVETGLGQRL